MTNPVTPTGTPAPSGGGMPKWLVILLVVLVVISLGCCGGIATCFFFVRKAVKEGVPAFTQKIADEEKKQGMELNFPDASGTAAMPSNFPSDIPVYTGAKTIQSAANTKQNSGEATFTTSDAAADVKTYYEKQMGDGGWKEDATSTAGTDSFSMQFSKDTSTAGIQINHSGPQTTVVISYGKK